MIQAFRRLATCALILLAVPAAAFETSARAAYVLDQTTGTVLLAKNADVALPPASMSKLMTLYVTFEALRDGRLTLDERLPVSEAAMAYKGSTMFLNTTDRVRVEDLLRGIIVMSANDATVVLAVALSPDGSEGGFARFMTKRARAMGMTNSTFTNSNGWPQEGHRMSVRDLGILASRIISDFPEFYPMFAETEFEFDGRAPSNTKNRNPLLKLGIGADGLKTGHTDEAGFGIVGSAVQGGRRVVFVLTGMETAAQRAEQAEAIINWSFRNFIEKTVVTAGTPVAKAEIWLGSARSVNLVPKEDVTILVPALSAGALQAEAIHVGPIEAPILKGQVLGELVISPDELPEIRVPLVAERDVAKGGFMVRVGAAAQQLLNRLANGPDEVPDGAS